MSIFTGLRHGLLAVLAMLLIAAPAFGAEFPTETLTIHRAAAVPVTLTVEVAATPALRGQGLMYRETMAADRGMIFDFRETRPVYMWMKNTYLPLDMVFADQAGIITHIATDTLPLSEAIVSSRGPVRFVLEVNAGETTRLGIRPGDRLESPTITAAGR